MEQKIIEAAQGILNWANSNQPLWAKQTLKRSIGGFRK